MLDHEIGDKLIENAEGVDLIIKTLENWYGKESSVDLYQSFIQWKEMKRGSGQDVLDFITKYEDAYNRLQNFGETISDKLRAMLLLESSDLSYLTHNLVLSTVNFSDKSATDVYNSVKVSIRKYHASDEIHKTPSVLVAKDEAKEDKTNSDGKISKEIEAVMLEKGWKPPSKEKSKDKEERVWKCKICLCKCLPKYKRCDCPCSHHRWYDCPDRKKESTENKSKKEDLVKNTEAETPLYCNFLGGGGVFFVREMQTTSSTRSIEALDNPEQVYHSKEKLMDHHSHPKENSCSFAITDSACPSTMCGRKWLHRIYNSYPSSVAAQFARQESSKVFQFGGGEKAPSIARVTFPILIMDVAQNLHLVQICTEVVEADIVLLLGGNSLRKAQAILDFSRLTLSLPSLGKDVRIPLRHSDSGHFTFDLIPVSKAEEIDAAKCLLVQKVWSKTTANRAVSYVVSNNQEDVKMEPFTRSNTGIKIKENFGKLSKKDINKLHHVFGHAGKDKLEALIKRAERWHGDIENYLQDIKKNCEVCKLEAKTSPRPNVAYPRAVHHNHVLAIDLKENIKFPNAGDYILYMVDCFTRFKMACFIKDKKATTVAEALFKHWIKWFGAPKILHSDRGKEFVNDELLKLCELHGTKVTNTAARTPNANGLCEKQHWWVDKMMEKISLVNPDFSAEILLGWCIHAANTLDMKNGYSPHILVFGKNPTHPILQHPNPTMSKSPEFSKHLADNINMMYQAREAFVQLESESTLREALKQRLYARVNDINLQDWIYFKQQNRWHGPVKVVGIEGKRIHCMRAGRLITVNKDMVILSKSEDEFQEIGEPFISLPEHLKDTGDSLKGDLYYKEPVKENQTHNDDEESALSLDGAEYSTTLPRQIVASPISPQQSGQNPQTDVPKAKCKACKEVLPRSELVSHNKDEHDIVGNMRQVSESLSKLVDETEVFISSVKDEQTEDCYVITLPRSEHNSPEGIAAKVKELGNFKEFGVYDVVDIPPNSNILPTQWVLVQKEDEKGNLITKARLCIRGDLELNKHNIPTDSPTINKITLKLILTIAASKGWSLQTSDITRAFLQTEDLDRKVYVKPPEEAETPQGTVWLLKKCCYGLIDAGRSFFLKHGSELKKLGMETLKMDPACFLYFEKIEFKERQLKGIIGCHVDDTIALGEKALFDKVVDEMKNRFTYRSHNKLPLKYLSLQDFQ